MQVFENGKLVPKKRRITLRMLLSHTGESILHFLLDGQDDAVPFHISGEHQPCLLGPGVLTGVFFTAGFGYSFFDQRLNDWAGPLGLDEFSGSYHDYLSQPLVNQPGERWEYGINIDWAGQLVERVSGLKLNDYFQQHIFKPMGITHITMFPTDEMKAHLAYMNSRAPDGSLSLNIEGHLNRRPLYATTKEEIDATFHAGGAGCFARLPQYCQIIAMLLNDGVHPGTGAHILKKVTVDQMFTNQVWSNTPFFSFSPSPPFQRLAGLSLLMILCAIHQIPDMPNFGRQGIQPPKPLLSNALADLYPDPHDVPQGWGLTFFLHLRDSAVHSEGTGWWAGLPNLFWWADRKRVCRYLSLLCRFLDILSFQTPFSPSRTESHIWQSQ